MNQSGHEQQGSAALPPHIAAALRGAGGESDTAGQPWQGRELNGQYHQFDDDNGAANQELSLALAGLVEGSADEAAVVASLAHARVFVPIVATATVTGSVEDGGAHDHLHGDKESEMALVVVSAPDGRSALPVFSTVQNLTAWHPQARPVAVYAPRAALSAAAEDAQLLVLDPGSEITFVVRRPAMWALAQQRRWLPSYADLELHQEIRSVLLALDSADLEDRLGKQTTRESNLLGLDILPGAGIRSAGTAGAVRSGGGSGPELRLVLLLRPGLSADSLDAFVAAVQTTLARNEMFAQRVDSLEVSVHSASNEVPDREDPENRS